MLFEVTKIKQLKYGKLPLIQMYLNDVESLPSGFKS